MPHGGEDRAQMRWKHAELALLRKWLKGVSHNPSQKEITRQLEKWQMSGELRAGFVGTDTQDFFSRFDDPLGQFNKRFRTEAGFRLRVGVQSIVIELVGGSAAAHPGNRLSQSRNSKTQAAQQLVSGVPRRRFSAQRALARVLTAMLIAPENLAALADLPGRWIGAVHDRRQPNSPRRGSPPK